MDDHKDVIHLLAEHIKNSRKDDGKEFKHEHLALDAMKEFYRQSDFYKCHALVTADYLPELKNNLKELKRLLSKHDEGDIDGVCFELVEVFCVIMREASFAAGNPSPVAVQLFEYFETCGQWNPTDGGKISECYYIALPARYAA